MDKINKETITKVRIRKHRRDISFRRKGDKIVWADSLWDWSPISVERFRIQLPYYRVINKAIIEGPGLSISTSCGGYHTFNFRTMGELENWYEKNLSDINFIEKTLE